MKLKTKKSSFIWKDKDIKDDGWSKLYTSKN